ncbi:MAG: hypothetical protein ACOYVG_02745 [Bacteroidota bacterium]
MAGFSFLSRLAFICNLFFLGAILARIFLHIDELQQLGIIGNTVVVMGLLLSPIINMGVHLMYLVIVMRKRQTGVRLWIRVFNLFLLIAQLIFYIILPA